jgi:hypothetical protein
VEKTTSSLLLVNGRLEQERSLAKDEMIKEEHGLKSTVSGMRTWELHRSFLILTGAAALLLTKVLLPYRVPPTTP